mmetsp:Transcript_46328/g.99203  ORF Transcript_46328/g.99203 Transcript_46328/m.99203 type:complete len:210 (-) Transcript_46328:639-1268(-)
MAPSAHKVVRGAEQSSELDSLRSAGHPSDAQAPALPGTLPAESEVEEDGEAAKAARPKAQEAEGNVQKVPTHVAAGSSSGSGSVADRDEVADRIDFKSLDHVVQVLREDSHWPHRRSSAGELKRLGAKDQWPFLHITARKMLRNLQSLEVLTIASLSNSIAQRAPLTTAATVEADALMSEGAPSPSPNKGPPPTISAVTMAEVASTFSE